MLQLMLALITTLSLTFSLSTHTVKGGDEFTGTVVVNGPYEGPVCALVGYDESQEIVGRVCYPEVVTVEDGKTQTVVLEFVTPQNAHGAFSFMVVLADEADTSSNVEHLTVQ